MIQHGHVWLYVLMVISLTIPQGLVWVNVQTMRTLMPKIPQRCVWECVLLIVMPMLIRKSAFHNVMVLTSLTIPLIDVWAYALNIQPIMQTLQPTNVWPNAHPTISLMSRQEHALMSALQPTYFDRIPQGHVWVVVIWLRTPMLIIKLNIVCLDVQLIVLLTLLLIGVWPYVPINHWCTLMIPPKPVCPCALE